MNKKSLLTLVFALLFAVFFLALILFRIPFHLYPLINYQDVLDLLTPLVLIPLYWVMFRYKNREGSQRDCFHGPGRYLGVGPWHASCCQCG
jgi:hypothetical protein